MKSRGKKAVKGTRRDRRPPKDRNWPTTPSMPSRTKARSKSILFPSRFASCSRIS